MNYSTKEDVILRLLNLSSERIRALKLALKAEKDVKRKVEISREIKRLRAFAGRCFAE